MHRLTAMEVKMIGTWLLLVCASRAEYRQKIFSEENHLNDVTAVILRREEIQVSSFECTVLCLQTEGCSDIRLIGDPPRACDLMKGTSPGGDPFMYTKGPSEVCINETLGLDKNFYTDALSLAQTYGKITKVEIWAGYVIDGFRLHYGSYLTPIQGESSSNHFSFDLAEDEFITEVSAVLAKMLPVDNLRFLDDCLALLRFKTNHGKEYGPYGNVNREVPAGHTRIKPGSYTVSTGYRMVTMYYGPNPLRKFPETLVPVYNACL